MFAVVVAVVETSGVTVSSAAGEFTSDRAMRVAQEAAAAAGLPHGRLELVRFGSNAILRLPGGVVARVARDESSAAISEREVRVAAALHAAGVSCVRPWPVRQPVVALGHPVTFWVEIPGPLERPTLAELGAVLRQLHDVDAGLDLPALAPWAHIPDRIEQAPISGADRQVLRDALAAVQDGWSTARFELGTGSSMGTRMRATWSAGPTAALS